MRHTNNRVRVERLLLLLAALLYIGAMACNTHELNPFNASVDSAAIETTSQIEVQPADILFIVDNSNSMCEEQDKLVKNFDDFIGALAKAGVDFHIAVATSDMTGQSESGPPGAFRTGPGTYSAAGCPNPPKLDGQDPAIFCAGRGLPSDGILRKADYPELSPSDESSFDKLRFDFACLALTGIDGNGTEMGLASAKKALENNKDNFLRRDQNAYLSLVFVTDENDCSDGTVGSSRGAVYEQVQKDGNDNACEFNRNIEDSCALVSENSVQIEHLIPAIEVDAETGVQTETETLISMTGLEWCQKGDRAIVEELVASGDIQVNCPEGGCTNLLTPRQEFYDFIIDDLGYTQDQVIVASILNTDNGKRYEPGAVTEGNTVASGDKLPSACGRVDKVGYRYELFTKMFADDLAIVGDICFAGRPEDFAEKLKIIADTIGEAINSVCLQSPPAQCSSDGVGNGSCAAGEICCPGEQLCGRRIDGELPECAADPNDPACTEARKYNKRTFYEGKDHEYKLCSGFRVVVGEQINGEFVEFTEGADYTVTYKNAEECGESSPLKVHFLTAPSENLIVKYPQEVGRNVNEN